MAKKEKGKKGTAKSQHFPYLDLPICKGLDVDIPGDFKRILCRRMPGREGDISEMVNYESSRTKSIVKQLARTNMKLL